LTHSTKEQLRIDLLRPKTKLAAMRKSKNITTAQMAEKLGLSRRQYELKENGKYPFNDYEMLAITQKFNVDIQDIFLKNNISL